MPQGLSPRPTLLPFLAPDGTDVGFDESVSNDRVVATLPLKSGPVLIAPALVLNEPQLGYVADPQGNLVGEFNATWVDRLLPATTTWDTRRL